ncbi:hypothetical protein OAD66_01250 [Bacteroidia bacterium]|nr:hypothetical protein [Bacteroidia bacterium]MDB9881742.1 hypothetical protein [Bacteroidia bacterium]
MKKTFNLLMILALGAAVFTLNSCSEEPAEDPTPAETICYLTQSEEDGEVTTYSYDSDNNVISSISYGDTTTFEYSGGRLNLAYDGSTEATFIYESGNVPSRINLQEDGQSDGYIIMTNTNGNITKIEQHDVDDQIQDVTFATYDANGNLLSVINETWDADLKEFETMAEITNIVTDGKKNPYSTSLALIYADLENPLNFGQSNIVSGDFVVFDQAVPVTSSYTYNANNYPTSSVLTALGEETIFNFTYNCK